MAQPVNTKVYPPPVVVCVLKSGGEYGAEHVRWLKQQIDDFTPGVDFLCLSDVPVPCSRIPLALGYKGWWSKIELLRPSVTDRDVVFFDLDTVVVGSIESLLAIGDTSILRDVYRQGDALQSSVMYLTAEDRRDCWELWQEQESSYWFQRFARLGDQGFFEYALPYCLRLQDELPEMFVSYKADIMAKRGEKKDETPPKSASVVFFHGRPRPWDVRLPWIPPLQEEMAV